jgi:hypothetical protein
VRDHAEPEHVRAQRIDALGTLSNRQITRAVLHELREGFAADDHPYGKSMQGAGAVHHTGSGCRRDLPGAALPRPVRRGYLTLLPRQRGSPPWCQCLPCACAVKCVCTIAWRDGNAIGMASKLERLQEGLRE